MQRFIFLITTLIFFSISDVSAFVMRPATVAEKESSFGAGFIDGIIFFAENIFYIVSFAFLLWILVKLMRL